MENEKVINLRLNAIEKTIDKQTKQINELDEELKTLSQRHNDRYVEIATSSARLQESAQSQKDIVLRLVTSIDGLVAEMKTTNDTFSNRFTDVEKRFAKLEKQLGEHSYKPVPNELASVDTTSKSESDKDNLGNTQKGVIVLAIIGVLEAFIRYVAPLFFN